MPSQLFSGKTKEDLIEIVRLTDVMPISQARKMKKSELSAFLEENKNLLATPAKPSSAKKRGRPKKKSRLLPEENERILAQLQGRVGVEQSEHTSGNEEREAQRPEGSQENERAVVRNGAAKRRRGRRPATAQPTLESKQRLPKQSSKRIQEGDNSSSISKERGNESTLSVHSGESEGSRNRTRRGRKPGAKRNLVREKDSFHSSKAITEEEQQSTPVTGGLDSLEMVPEWAMPEVIEVEEQTQPRESRFRKDSREGTKRFDSRRNTERRKDGNGLTRENLVETNSTSFRSAEMRPDGEDLETNSIPNTETELRPDTEAFTGILNLMPDGFGFAHTNNYLPGTKDVYISPQMIRRFHLRPGDELSGTCRHSPGNRNPGISYLYTVNGHPVDVSRYRQRFDRLTPVYPDTRLVLETESKEFSTRIIDLISPIGKGQRGLIVSPPKAGKTILLKKVANAIAKNNPEVRLLVLLVDERPEEVTDMQRSIQGEVMYSTFDKSPENHVRLAELVLERAMRLVEEGEDVVILLDSITRLARAYNLTINPTGRTLSGGVDPGALYGPKKFFGAARNIENGGSLTILATALVETGSRMDEVIFEEFKGTGNMEVYLDRKLSEKRIFPAIDINRSGTRREDLLLNSDELDAVWNIRKAMGQLDTAKVTEMILALMQKQGSNSQFVRTINASFIDKATET